MSHPNIDERRKAAEALLANKSRLTRLEISSLSRAFNCSESAIRSDERIIQSKSLPNGRNKLQRRAIPAPDGRVIVRVWLDETVYAGVCEGLKGRSPSRRINRVLKRYLLERENPTTKSPKIKAPPLSARESKSIRESVRAWMNESESKLKAIPHPFRPGSTLYDYAIWRLENRVSADLLEKLNHYAKGGVNENIKRG